MIRMMMTTMTTRQRIPAVPMRRLFLLVILVILQCSVRWVWSMPMFLMEIPSQKCIEVEGPVDSTIRIMYYIPDLVLDKEDEEYYTGPVKFTLNTVPSNRVHDTKDHMAPVMSRLKPKAEGLVTKTGSIEHTFEVDGTANICFTIDDTHHADISATHLRLGVSIQYKEIADFLLEIENGNVTATPPSKLLEQKETEMTEKRVVGHLSSMEMELKMIERSMKTVLKEADFAKERDALQHKQVISVHSASMFWPIVQVCVLLMTGFTQASHIVHFFKSHRII